MPKVISSFLAFIEKEFKFREAEGKRSKHHQRYEGPEVKMSQHRSFYFVSLNEKHNTISQAKDTRMRFFARNPSHSFLLASPKVSLRARITSFLLSSPPSSRLDPPRKNWNRSIQSCRDEADEIESNDLQSNPPIPSLFSMTAKASLKHVVRTPCSK